MSPNNINDFYVEWAASLDSAGQDSTEAQARASNPVTLQSLLFQLRAFINRGQQIGALKKFIFYGKTIDSDDYDYGNPISAEAMNQIASRIEDHEVIRYLHLVLGLIDEAEELVEPLFNYLLSGVPIDPNNVREELGDTMWYIGANGAKWLGDETLKPILEANYRKLTTRYPEGAWTQDRAINRDLDREKAALEVRGLDPQSLQTKATGGTYRISGSGDKDGEYAWDESPEKNTGDQ